MDHHIGLTYADQARLRFLAVVQAGRGPAALSAQIAYWRSTIAAESAAVQKLLDQIMDEFEQVAAKLPQDEADFGEILRSLEELAPQDASTMGPGAADSCSGSLVLEAVGAASMTAVLQRWGARWRWGDVEWLVEIGRHTIARWILNRGHRDQLLWEWPRIDVWAVPSLVVPGFNPFAETAEEFRDRLDSAAFQQMKEARAALGSEGYASSAPRSQPQAYFWLLLMTALDLSAYGVVRAGHAGSTSEKSVREAAKRLGDTLGLALPRRAAGRPRAVANP